MCGIAGILRLHDADVSLDRITLMTEAMRHRGPDDEGIAVFSRQRLTPHAYGGKDTPDEVYNAHFPYIPRKNFSGTFSGDWVAAFGHRRLSIIDLSSSGHQPMCTEDQRYWIIFNGEMYNFQEVRAELKKLGETFVSQTDTEVVLKAYRRWGRDCLTKFNGMWAFAIWDDTEKTLFCSRDRIGIKPFYYYLTEKLFLFASDIKTLIASGLYPPEPDWEGIYHAMSFQCAPRPMTCFKGVRALEQAHCMTIDLQGRMRQERYWHLPVGDVDYSKSEAQWAEELESVLKMAVRRRLVADVPVGTFMSGGIDSTSISALAAQVHPGIQAFTLAYEDTAPEMDELPQAKATAAMWPMNHTIEVIKPESTLAHISEMIRCYEEPFHSLAPNYMISKLVSDHKVTVILNGLGGDELFCGYGRERWLALWKYLKWGKWGLSLLPNLHPNIMRAKELANASDVSEVYVQAFSIFSEQEKQQFFSRNASQDWNSPLMFKRLYHLRDLHFTDDIEALGYMDIINYIGNHHVYRVDQFTMRFGLEGRFPFLDHELVELACHMPGNMKVRNGQGKYVLRKVAKDVIHPTCLQMKKKGFSLPVKQWMHSALHDLVNDKIASLKQRGIFRAAAVGTLYQRFYTHRELYAKLWFLVSLEMWLEEFIDSHGLS